MDKFYVWKSALLYALFKDRKQLKLSLVLGVLVLCFLSFQAQAQQITATGTVRDSKGAPIPGVSVKIKSTTTGTLTNENGKYTLRNVPTGAMLVFSSISYVSKELTVRPNMDVELIDDNQNLNEVVVVGYGTQKKATLTGAVAQINSEEIMRSPTPNATNALIGKLPGLLAVQTSGQPGADASSLFVRGISTFNNASAIVVVDGIERPSFGDIDPNEIETVTVLKDAASTAIYGIKGANGVIVITTKQGKIGAPRITYTGNYSVQTYTGLPFALGSYDNARLLNQAYLNDGKAAPWSDAELQKFKDGSDPYGYPDVQWFKYLTKKFYGQTQHNFNVSGGSKVAKYFVSAGYAYQDGIFKHFDSPYGIETTPSFTRYNFRSNVDLTLNKDFTVGIKLGGRYSDRYQPAGLLSSSAFSYDTIEGMISRILQVPSFAYPVTLPDGRIAQNPGVGTNLWNPLAVLTRFGTRNDDNNTIESTFNVEYKLGWITKGLSFKGNFGYDSYYTNVQRRNANWAAYVWDRQTGAISLSTDTRNRDVPLGGINGSTSGSTNTTIQTGFYYNRSFGRHNVSGLLMGTRQLIQGSSDGSVFTAPPRASQGLVNRLTYNYSEKYFVEFNASYNGSENFAPASFKGGDGKNHQYGFFPAVSAGWTMTNESFFPKSDILSYAKIRGSYGIVGNDKLDSRFLFLTSYSANSSVGFGLPSSITNYPTVYIADGALGNPQITWETGTKRNIGLETRMFKEMLKLDIDVFDETRKDILLDHKGLLDFGHSYPSLNIGKVYNKGYEIEADFQGQHGNFSYGINAQLSYAHNKILNYDEAADIPDNLKKQGKPVGQFFGYVFDGFYTSAQDVANSVKPQGVAPIPGDLKFKDLNGDGIINDQDQQPIGYSNRPEYIYSFTPRIAYKGFSLNVMFQGVAHVSSNLILNDQNNGQQMYPFMLNAWTPQNAATATWPALHSRGYTGLNNALNSFTLQNARYLKLRTVEIAYTFPKSWTDPLKLKGVRMYLNGQNLITWTPFKMYVDPENLNVVNQAFPLQSLYPSSRVFNIGININF
ncbi:TonB-linked SusC/RagA family outer membrane protein [Mucilaginibacter yixingensis]|uniref:TonB-linked SusC/RagA family outer membrane protein n=1 Tax=Mucilaginibacter yixingensis TaxID=1295612 RepID=A0A2T5JAP3_9SPHI|nr:TonB-dependent receptor [Mucilaginibacter yixingensis]PTQ97869.1 TonB-linked SusC/RagA family outer membrane protein [Mucilaginibacter yixingensis]